MRLYLGFALLAVVGAAAFYWHNYAAPSCGSDQVLNSVYQHLRHQPQLDSIILNGVRTESGTFFSRSRTCAAQVAQIRGSTSASDMPWRKVRFHVARGDAPDNPLVTVELGGQTSLAPPPPSLWQRLLDEL